MFLDNDDEGDLFSMMLQRTTWGSECLGSTLPMESPLSFFFHKASYLKEIHVEMEAHEFMALFSRPPTPGEDDDWIQKSAVANDFLRLKPFAPLARNAWNMNKWYFGGLGGDASVSLHRRILMRDTRGLVRLIEEDREAVHGEDDLGVQPLMLALMCGNAEATRALLDNGATLACGSKDNNYFGFEPLHYLAWGGSVECLELVYEYVGVARGAEDRDPLAILTARKDRLNHLTALDRMGMSPLAIAMSFASGRFVEALLERFAPHTYVRALWEAGGGSGRPPLVHAVLGGNMDAIRGLFAFMRRASTRRSMEDVKQQLLRRAGEVFGQPQEGGGAETNTLHDKTQAICDFMRGLIDEGVLPMVLWRSGDNPCALEAAVESDNDVLLGYLVKESGVLHSGRDLRTLDQMVGLAVSSSAVRCVQILRRMGVLEPFLRMVGLRDGGNVHHLVASDTVSVAMAEVLWDPKNGDTVLPVQPAELQSALDHSGQSVYHLLVEKRDHIKLGVLLRNGVLPDCRNARGVPVLVAAAIHRSPECVELVAGALWPERTGMCLRSTRQYGSGAQNGLVDSLFAHDETRLSALHACIPHAMEVGGNVVPVLTLRVERAVKIMRLLFMYTGIGADWEDANGTTALFHCIKTIPFADLAAIPILEVLLKNGASVGRWDRNSEMTPLMQAAALGHLGVCEFLIKNGANTTDRPSSSLWTPLMYVLTKQCVGPRTLRVFFNDTKRRGVPIPAHQSMGETPLHIAVNYFCSARVLEMLVDEGCDINAPNRNGNTPLHIAVGRGNHEASRFLVEHGAHLSAKNIHGRTPQNVASHNLARQIVVDEVQGSQSRRPRRRFT